MLFSVTLTPHSVYLEYTLCPPESPHQRDARLIVVENGMRAWKKKSKNQSIYEIKRKNICGLLGLACSFVCAFYFSPLLVLLIQKCLAFLTNYLYWSRRCFIDALQQAKSSSWRKVDNNEAVIDLACSTPDRRSQRSLGNRNENTSEARPLFASRRKIPAEYLRFSIAKRKQNTSKIHSFYWVKHYFPQVLCWSLLRFFTSPSQCVAGRVISTCNFPATLIFRSTDPPKYDWIFAVEALFDLSERGKKIDCS